jgi:tRNA dimethylallyltransferase
MQSKLIIAIGGVTGSGKTALALTLAQKYPQLVILSADSRQVYKKLNIGTAKVGEPATNDLLTGQPEPVWVAERQPQFLIDLAEPNITYTLADYQKEAYRLIRACWEKGKIPILVGGTGLYLQAIIQGYIIEGEPDSARRNELQQLSLTQLQQLAKEKQAQVGSLDWPNPRRLIRAIERVERGVPVASYRPITPHTQVFVLDRPWEEQRNLAPAMVRERLEIGLIAETQELLQVGVDKQWLKGMGLSYRLVIQMLDNEFSLNELETRMIHEFRKLMRRQRTWFNRFPNSHKLNAGEIEFHINQLLG